MNTHDFTQPRSMQISNLKRSDRTYLLVLGMHRSGTSALTRILSLGGAALPQRLMAPNNSNQTGYWESKALVDFNDRLLADLGSTWRDWGRLDLATAGPAFRQAAKRSIQEILAADYCDARLAVVKDPRVCRFTGLMLEALEEQGIRPAPVLPFRNPLEVMASLQLRDRLSPGDAAMLWLRHVLDADAATRRLPRVVLSYETLLADWQTALTRIDGAFDLTMPNGIAAIAPIVAEFLSAEQRHHVSSTHEVLHDPLLRGWIADTYTALKILETTPDSPSALATLDKVRRNVDDATPVLLALTGAIKTESQQKIADRDRQLASLRADLARQTAEATARAETAERHAEDVSAKFSATTLELETTRKELARAEQLAEETKARADAAELEGKELRARLEATTDELVTTREAAAAEKRQTEMLSERLSENDKLISGFKEHVHILLASLKEQQSTHASLERTLDDLTAKHMANAEENARLTREVQQHKDDAAKAKAETAVLHQAKEASDKAKADTAAELQKAKEATDQARTEKLRLESRLNERFGEIAMLTQLLREKEAPSNPTQSRFKRAARILFKPRRWPQLWQRLRLVRDISALKRSGLFDAEWYLNTYTDVAAAKADPLRHYVQFGAAEGRKPSASATPGTRPRRTDCIHR